MAKKGIDEAKSAEVSRRITVQRSGEHVYALGLSPSRSVLRFCRNIFKLAANIFRQRRTERFFVLYHAGFLEYYTEPPPWVLPLRASATRSYLPTDVLRRRGWVGRGSASSEYEDTVTVDSVLMGCLRIGTRTSAKLGVAIRAWVGV